MKILYITDEKIIFDNGYILKYYHVQDCCENVYADFEILNTYNLSTKTGKEINIKEIDFEEDMRHLIEGIKDTGFNMISKIGEKFFIPCYNEQNGYYGSDLELILIKNDDIYESFNISEYVEDKIF